MLQNNPILKSKIDQLWSKFWAGGISNPLTAIEQITYLLFIKRLDELDFNQQGDADFAGDTFTSRFAGTWLPPEHRDKPKSEQKLLAVERSTLRWREFKRMPAEQMLSHVQSKVFPFIKDLNGEASNFTHHMKNAVFLIPKPSLMVEAVKAIDEIFEEMEKDSKQKGQAFQDIQGDVYDKEDKMSEPATEHVWFYDMGGDGYSLDDKRNKQEGFGDLQDIVEKFKKRDPQEDTDRTRKYFAVPRQEIVDEKFDLSLTRYKEEVFEEIAYEKPDVILQKLLESEVGEGFDEEDLVGIQGGIVKELLELQGLVG